MPSIPTLNTRGSASLALFLGATVLSGCRGTLPTPATGTDPTALDRYVATPDPAYTWKVVSEETSGGIHTTVIDMTSQRWLTTNEVNQPVWRHWVNIVRPEGKPLETALLFITGGNNRPGNPPKPGKELAAIAKANQSAVVELRMVPNQPLVFGGDGEERVEDNLIGYSWDKFLRTGDERWPARLPMTKAAVRAMDTVTDYFKGSDGGGFKVDRFVVAGGSKRGWTTWTTAAVDRRVVAICPIVIDVLNLEPSMQHHYQAYGFWAPSVGDYVRHRSFDWFGTPQNQRLKHIEDPFEYRGRMTMPKLILNACGDQFFLPDSSQFYFHQLPGVKYLRYVPNADHSLKGSDAYETLLAWHHLVGRQQKFPQFSWSEEQDGSLRVQVIDKPREVRLWQATNPAARDFRLETLGPVWKSTTLSEQPGGIYSAHVPAPAQGWTASLIELTFDVGASTPLKLTTHVRITPDTLPFKPFVPQRP